MCDLGLGVTCLQRSRTQPAAQLTVLQQRTRHAAAAAVALSSTSLSCRSRETSSQLRALTTHTSKHSNQRTPCVLPQPTLNQTLINSKHSNTAMQSSILSGLGFCALLQAVCKCSAESEHTSNTHVHKSTLQTHNRDVQSDTHPAHKAYTYAPYTRKNQFAYCVVPSTCTSTVHTHTHHPNMHSCRSGNNTTPVAVALTLDAFGSWGEKVLRRREDANGPVCKLFGLHTRGWDASHAQQCQISSAATTRK
jgi:hypothetical protein